MDRLWIVNHVLSKSHITRAYYSISKTLGERLLDLREKIIYSYLDEKYVQILDNYQNQKMPEEHIQRNAPIWIFWAQGEVSMPPMVHKCYESVLANANRHSVNLVTMDNVGQYVEIPDYILEKVKRGRMTYTAFSDILRMALLSEHGGIWMDATIYMSGKFPDKMYNTNYFTYRHAAKSGKIRLEPSRCRWRSFFMATVKDSVYTQLIRDLSYAYARDFDCSVDYFMVDIFIQMGYCHNISIRNAIDAIEESDMGIYTLQDLLNEPYDHNKFIKCASSNYINKLSWRGSYIEQTEDGSPTFYGTLFG